MRPVYIATVKSTDQDKNAYEPTIVLVVTKPDATGVEGAGWISMPFLTFTSLTGQPWFKPDGHMNLPMVGESFGVSLSPETLP